MRFIDEEAKDDLAKASTILQCMLSILDYECNKHHVQIEIVNVIDNVALVDLDPLDEIKISDICSKVNKQFQRKDGKYSCKQEQYGKRLVRCEALKIDDYILLA